MQRGQLRSWQNACDKSQLAVFYNQKNNLQDLVDENRKIQDGIP